MIPANEQALDVDFEEDDSGLEVEREDKDLKITRPFDPEKIKIRTTSVVVELLISRIKHSEIDLAPDFQRLRGVWNDTRKSRLIESLMLRIPIPVFYVAEDRRETWAVVDGLQRLSTIYDFVVGEFSLTNLEYLSSLEGSKYSDLPRSMQRRINETTLIFNIIEPGTPEEVMFNIFFRINTGGLTLNGQEIRNALNKGPVRQYLRELAEMPEFRRATDGSVKPDRMADRECALRFLAFSIEPWEKYTSYDLDGYLGQTMKKINGMPENKRDRLKIKFKNSMKCAYRIFGNDAFRKRYSFEDSRKPVSKALFEVWSVGLARLTTEQRQTLIAHKERVRRDFVDLMNDDREFEAAISYSTGAPQRVEKRFQEIENIIRGCL